MEGEKSKFWLIEIWSHREDEGVQPTVIWAERVDRLGRSGNPVDEGGYWVQPHGISGFSDSDAVTVLETVWAEDERELPPEKTSGFRLSFKDSTDPSNFQGWIDEHGNWMGVRYGGHEAYLWNVHRLEAHEVEDKWVRVLQDFDGEPFGVKRSEDGLSDFTFNEPQAKTLMELVERWEAAGRPKR